MDKRLKIFLSTAGVLVAGGLLAIIVVAGGSGAANTVGKAKMVLETTSFDFGDVSMANGKVTKTINVKNEGDADLEISKLFTSCMCTTAQIVHPDGSKSGLKGMIGHGGGSSSLSETIPAGETAVLLVNFDPNAHGPAATGPITRTVTMRTNSQSQPEIRLTFSGNVIK